MERIVKVGEREVKFKASAMTPLIYKRMYERELFTDIINGAATTSEMEQLELLLDLGCVSTVYDK